MRIKVRIPSPLRKFTKEQSEIQAEGRNIADIIENLEQNYPGIKERLCDSDGGIRRFLNIYLNEEDIRFLKGSETPLKEGDEVSIVPAIAGGNDERVTRLKVHVTFPEDMIREPIIYQISKEHNVVINIRKADVNDKTGWVDLELTGPPQEVEQAITGLKNKGVKVDPIERNIIE